MNDNDKKLKKVTKVTRLVFLINIAIFGGSMLIGQKTVGIILAIRDFFFLIMLPFCGVCIVGITLDRAFFKIVYILAIGVSLILMLLCFNARGIYP